MFDFHHADDVNVVAFHLPDEMDALEFDRLNASVREMLDGQATHRWIVDLNDVQYMGSAVLGLMVNMRQDIKSARGRLVLCGLSPRLVSIFRNCCLERLFTIVKTREEALLRV